MRKSIKILTCDFCGHKVKDEQELTLIKVDIDNHPNNRFKNFETRFDMCQHCLRDYFGNDIELEKSIKEIEVNDKVRKNWIQLVKEFFKINKEGNS